jgi:hypothetical protein
VRIPGGSWLVIEPCAESPTGPWSRCDRLWQVDQAAADGAKSPDALGTPLTVFESLDYAGVDRIPALAEPSRLPPGGGTAVLNLIAALAADQGAAPLPYRGPYPTEQLFLALLEAFRYEARSADPLAEFMRGGVDWIPAPAERVFAADGTYVQLRGRVEKVVWRGRPYHRRHWQAIARRTGRCVRDADDGVRCSLWALETVLEDHLLLTADGDVVRALEPSAASDDVRPISACERAGIVCVVSATSAPALGPSLRAVGDDLTLEWGPTGIDLIRVEGARVRVTNRLRELIADRLGRATTRETTLAVGLAGLAEVAFAIGDTLRARAQARLLAAPPEIQAEALATDPPTATAASGVAARAIAAAVETLVTATAQDE